MSEPVPPFFLFDGACGFCRRWVQWLDRRVGGTVVFVPSEAITDLGRLGLTDADVARASFWVAGRGATFRGSRSIAQVLKQANGIWRVIGTVLDLPVVRLAAAAAYLGISHNRHRLPAPRAASAVRSTRNLADRLRPLRRITGPVEAAQVRRFGRSALSVLFRTPVLVLETVGRRTGTARRATLAYHRLDDALLVVGGAGGQSRAADWVLNLRANPDAVVIVDRKPVAVRAVELAGAEREATWRVLRDVWPRIDGYERRAGRTVPVFRLDRV